ncbi:hypothetical protein [Nonomuraea sp. NPDC003754]
MTGPAIRVFLLRWWATRPSWVGILAMVAGILILGIITDLSTAACIGIVIGACTAGTALLAACDAYADVHGIPDNPDADDEPQRADDGADEPPAVAAPAPAPEDADEPPTRAPVYALDDQLEPGRYVRLTPRDDGEETEPWPG